jgi:foldase protein PrsA
MSRRSSNLLVAVSLVVSAGLVVGCNPPARENNGDNPGVIRTAGGASNSAAAVSSSKVVASVDGAIVTEDQLNKAMRDSFGLDTLLKLTQLEMANQMAAQAKESVTPEDVARERQITLKQQFAGQDESDYEALLAQFLSQQRVSMAEFDLGIRTNAALRAAVRPTVRANITEADERRLFGIKYGEKVRVRHIALSNMQEVAEAKRRLAAGVPFEQVAREMSRSPRTARLGGELPPFSATSEIGKAFVDMAFSLKVGEVSDAVAQDQALHLIKLEERIPPTAVKFEDYRDTLRAELEELGGTAELIKLRKEMAKRALDGLQIADPELKKEFDRRKAEAEAERNKALQKEDVLKQLPTTAPARVAPVPVAPPTPAPSEPAPAQPATPAPAPAPAPAAAATTQAAK